MRSRTGSAYLKHGVVVVSVRLRPGSKPSRWVARCPDRVDGLPVDLIYGRAVAAEMQRAYDSGSWDPLSDGVLSQPSVLAVSARSTRMRCPAQSAQNANGLDAPRVLTHAQEWARAQTYESAPKDRSRVELYLAPSPIASIPLAELRPKHILEHINWLKQQPSERGGTLASRTVRNAYDVLRRALDAAVIEELLVANPCAPIRGKLPAIRDKHPAERQTWIYSREDIAKLLTDPRIAPVRRVSYALQFLTGMRVGELAVLRWSDYDPTTTPLGRITIARAVKSVSKAEGETKTGAVKLVPVHPTLAAILDAWKREGWHAYMKRAPKPSDLIVPNQFGHSRNTNRHNRDLARDCRRIGVVHRHQHAMRHTFITHVQDDGADGNVIRWITHAPPRSAFDSYTRGQWQRLCTELIKLDVEAR